MKYWNLETMRLLSTVNGVYSPVRLVSSHCSGSRGGNGSNGSSSSSSNSGSLIDVKTFQKNLRKKRLNVENVTGNKHLRTLNKRC